MQQVILTEQEIMTIYSLMSKAFNTKLMRDKELDEELQALLEKVSELGKMARMAPPYEVVCSGPTLDILLI